MFFPENHLFFKKTVVLMTFTAVGLGVSICESIMIALGGRITVDSRVGQGTTFALFFPITLL